MPCRGTLWPNSEGSGDFGTAEFTRRGDGGCHRLPYRSNLLKRHRDGVSRWKFERRCSVEIRRLSAGELATTCAVVKGLARAGAGHPASLDLGPRIRLDEIVCGLGCALFDALIAAWWFSVGLAFAWKVDDRVQRTRPHEGKLFPGAELVCGDARHLVATVKRAARRPWRGAKRNDQSRSRRIRSRIRPRDRRIGRSQLEDSGAVPLHDVDGLRAIVPNDDGRRIHRSFVHRWTSRWRRLIRRVKPRSVFQKSSAIGL